MGRGAGRPIVRRTKNEVNAVRLDRAPALKALLWNGDDAVEDVAGPNQAVTEKTFRGSSGSGRSLDTRVFQGCKLANVPFAEIHQAAREQYRAQKDEP